MHRYLSPLRLALALLAVFLVAGLVSCGSSKAHTTASTTIDIQDFAFHPAALHVKVGQTITVKNHDSAEHTVTANDKSFDTGPLRQGQIATFSLTKAGTFTYICTIHPYMTGSIEAS